MTDWPISRRQLLQSAFPGIAAGIAGCQGLFGRQQSSNSSPTEANSTDQRTRNTSVSASTPMVTGQAQSLQGTPVSGATAETLIEGGQVVKTTTTRQDGRFRLSTGGRPVWLKVTHPDYLARIRAVSPGQSALALRLTPSQDTIAVTFGGDVMFGRRFYNRETDPFDRHFWINPSTRLEDHRTILSYLQPILSTGDLTSVNLETPLTTAEWRHPTKTYTFTSHPVAARALADAGVDYVSLANTHTFDALTAGLTDTISSLNDAGIAHSGAGMNSAKAWQPRYIERSGIRIALISCTTTAGQQYEFDWSADRTQSDSYTVQHPTTPNESITVSGSVGAAEATPDRVTTAVHRARDNADAVVVQIHGGDEGVRTPSPWIERLTEAASQAGADLVVNHHPHVTGGLEYRNGSLVAWTLGNLIFDQQLWETFPSYLLTAHVHKDGSVRRAVVEPLLIEGYVPKGVVGELRRKLTWQVAGLSSDELVLTTDHLDTAAATGAEFTRAETTIEGREDIYARNWGWVTSITTVEGTVWLGRDRFLTGRFENTDLDADAFEAPLWRFGRDRSSTGPELGRESTGGVRLSRNSGNSQRALLRPVRRLPIRGTALTLTGWYQFDGHGDATLDVSWYDDTSGRSFDREAFTLGGTDGTWRRFRFRLTPSSGATYTQIFFWLAPPSKESVSRITFDELRLIEWVPEATGGRSFDHLYVDGAASVITASQQSVQPITQGWQILSE